MTESSHISKSYDRDADGFVPENIAIELLDRWRFRTFEQLIVARGVHDNDAGVVDASFGKDRLLRLFHGTIIPAQYRIEKTGGNRLSHLIAERTFRRSVPGRSFEVPMLTVAVDTAEQTFDETAVQVDSILASAFHDLVVALSVPDSHPDRVNLERQYGADPRVVVSGDPMAAVPGAALRLEVPPRVLVHPTDIDSLLRGLEALGVVRVDVKRAGVVRMARTRALRRAMRTGVSDPWAAAGVLFGERTMGREAVRFTVTSGKIPAPSGPSINPPAWVLVGKVVRKVVAIRTPADVATVTTWGVRGVGNVFHRARRAARQRRLDRRANRMTGPTGGALSVPGWVRVVGDPGLPISNLQREQSDGQCDHGSNW